jgi:hypothetical protein
MVMPFQEVSGSGVGQALHFLIGNVIAIHTGFAECWFGWRVGNIFATPDALCDYRRLQGAPLDKQQVAAEQMVRCWVYGKMEGQAVSMALFDSQRKDEPATTLAFSIDDHLISFRNHFLDWLGECGLPIAEGRRKMALWPEKTSLAGLQKVGQALEEFYIYSAYSGQGKINVAPFAEAARLAPASFMANNLLGWAHYRNQAAVPAKSFFLRALDLNPDAVGPMAGLMWCAVLEKDESTAVHWATRKAAKREEDLEAAAEKARKHFNA